MAPFEQRGDFAPGASPRFDSSPGCNQRFVTPVVTVTTPFHMFSQQAKTQSDPAGLLPAVQVAPAKESMRPLNAIQVTTTQHKTMQIRRVWAVLAACQLFWQLAGLQKAKKEQHKSVLFAVCLSRDASGPRTKQNSQAFRTILP